MKSVLSNFWSQQTSQARRNNRSSSVRRHSWYRRGLKLETLEDRTVLSSSWVTFGDASVIDGNTIIIGAPADEFDEQPVGYHGATLELAPAPRYSFTFEYDLTTWDSYSDFDGYWDSFSFSLTTEPFANLGVSDPLDFPFIWGGDFYTDGIIENNTGTITLDFLADPTGPNYLNVVLDTSSSPDTDRLYPSWGEVTVQAGIVSIDNDLSDEEFVSVNSTFSSVTGINLDSAQDSDFDLIQAQGEQYFIVGSADNDPLEQEVVILNSMASQSFQQFNLDSAEDSDFDVLVAKGQFVAQANIDNDPTDMEIIILDTSATQSFQTYNLDSAFDNDFDLVIVKGEDVLVTGSVDGDESENEIVILDSTASQTVQQFNLDSAEDSDFDLIIVKGEDVSQANVDNDTTDQEIIVVDSTASQTIHDFNLDSAFDSDFDLVIVQGDSIISTGSSDQDLDEEEVFIVSSTVSQTFNQFNLDSAEDSDFDIVLVKGEKGAQANVDNDEDDLETIVIDSTASQTIQDFNLDSAFDSDFDLVIVKGDDLLATPTVDDDLSEQEVFVLSNTASQTVQDFNLDSAEDSDFDVVIVKGDKAIQANVDNDETEQEVIVVDSDASQTLQQFNLDSAFDSDFDLVIVKGDDIAQATSTDDDLNELEVFVVSASASQTVQEFNLDSAEDSDLDVVIVKGEGATQANVDNDATDQEVIVVDSNATQTIQQFNLDSAFDSDFDLVIIKGDSIAANASADGDSSEQEVFVVSTTVTQTVQQFNLDSAEDSDFDVVLVKGAGGGQVNMDNDETDQEVVVFSPTAAQTVQQFNLDSAFDSDFDLVIVKGEKILSTGNLAEGNNTSEQDVIVSSLSATQTSQQFNLDSAEDNDLDLIVVQGQAYNPVAVINGPIAVSLSDTLMLDGSGSYDPDNIVGTGIVDYQWYDVTGGGQVLIGSEAMLSYQWASLGPKTVELVVTDNESATNVTTLEVLVTFDADLNGDGSVNFGDVGLFNAHFGLTDEDPDWDPRFDINNDGAVNFGDLGPFNSQFGMSIFDIPSFAGNTSSITKVSSPTTELTDGMNTVSTDSTDFGIGELFAGPDVTGRINLAPSNDSLNPPRSALNNSVSEHETVFEELGRADRGTALAELLEFDVDLETLADALLIV